MSWRGALAPKPAGSLWLPWLGGGLVGTDMLDWEFGCRLWLRRRRQRRGRGTEAAKSNSKLLSTRSESDRIES